MFGFPDRLLGSGVCQVLQVGAGRLQSGWNFSFLLNIHCPACAGAAGDRGL